MPAGTVRRRRRRRRIVTPEGVAIDVTLATLGLRAVALFIDLFLITVAFVGLLIAIGFSGFEDTEFWLALAAFAGNFLLRTFYFMFFELRWQGRTPGKRVMGLRVMNHEGAPLTAGAVLARNLTREVELFLPLIALLVLLVYLGQLGSWQAWLPLATVVWLGLFALMPLFNSERRRVGDMVGGTWVVEAPRALLLDDVGIGAGARTGTSAGFAFTPDQLREYGVYELQTLEDVLRLTGSAAEETLREVARRIKRRINWTEPPEADAASQRPFLEAYYAALRGNLETGMLFGRKRLRKVQRGSVPPSP